MGSGGITPTFLTLASDGGGWSASHSDRVTPGEIAPGTYGIGGWAGPGAGLDTAASKHSDPHRRVAGSKPAITLWHVVPSNKSGDFTPLVVILNDTILLLRAE